MTKLLAALGIILGGADAVFSLIVAFGGHITPDQHTAITAVGGLALLVLGVWFHPDTPVGPAALKSKNKKP